MKPLTGLFLLLLPVAICGCNQVSDPGGLNKIQLAIYTPICLDVQGASLAVGGLVQAYPCAPGKLSQEWDIKPVSATMIGEVTITNANSKMCMSVADDTSDLAPGQLILQEPCVTDGSQPNQLWTISSAPSGEAGMQIISVVSSQCLDLPYGATASIFDMQQYYCTADDPAQGWTFTPVSLGNTP